MGTPKEVATDAFSAARNRMGCVSGMRESGRSNAPNIVEKTTPNNLELYIWHNRPLLRGVSPAKF
jgi:hypothetical protein